MYLNARTGAFSFAADAGPGKRRGPGLEIMAMTLHALHEHGGCHACHCRSREGRGLRLDVPARRSGVADRGSIGSLVVGVPSPELIAADGVATLFVPVP